VTTKLPVIYRSSKTFGGRALDVGRQAVNTFPAVSRQTRSLRSNKMHSCMIRGDNALPKDQLKQLETDAQTGPEIQTGAEDHNPCANNHIDDDR
jgi:hypothetical protein